MGDRVSQDELICGLIRKKLFHETEAVLLNLSRKGMIVYDEIWLVDEGWIGNTIEVELPFSTAWPVIARRMKLVLARHPDWRITIRVTSKGKTRPGMGIIIYHDSIFDDLKREYLPAELRAIAFFGTVRTPSPEIKANELIWRRLFDEAKAALLHLSRAGAIAEKDIWLLESDLGRNFVAVELPLSTMWPVIAKRLQLILASYPEWQIWIDVRPEEESWPEMGLIISKDSVTDDLKREYLPNGLRHISFE